MTNFTNLLEDRITPDQLPVCPLCTSEITTEEPHKLVTAHGLKAIVHKSCYDELQDEEINEEE